LMIDKSKFKKHSKTDTIKERSIYVYLPSVDMVRNWKKKAKKAGISISKFVIENVENCIRESDEDFSPRSDLLEKVKKLEEENSELRKRNKILDKAIDNLESELRHYRTRPFLENDFSGFRKYEKDLIELFKSRKKVTSYELLDALGIDPKDSDVVKAINRQLENLGGYGLIEVIVGGWRWKE